jgi:TetR/AcrR family transcriptional regulator, transcriptional repressor for nem operon
MTNAIFDTNTASRYAPISCLYNQNWDNHMKVTKEKAAENRELILSQAARLFRERGISGVGVDALAEAAGLTHGSLYSQFGSKDKVLDESLSHGFAKIKVRASSIKSITDAISGYVSATHRDNPGNGCFMATLGCEMPRQSKEVRHTFTGIVKGNMQRLAALLPAGRKRKREDDVLAMMTSMVGAIVLSRAVDDAGFSDRILSVSRSRLLQLQEK